VTAEPSEVIAARATASTLPGLLLGHAATRGSAVALRQKTRGIWRKWTWAEVRDEVLALAHGLTQLGFTAGEDLALLGDTSPSSLWAASAAQLLRGVPIVLDPGSRDGALHTIVGRAGVRWAFADGYGDVERLVQASHPDTPMTIVVCNDDAAPRASATIRRLSYAHVRAAGIARQARSPEDARSWLVAATPADRAIAVITPDADGGVRRHGLDHHQLIDATARVANLATSQEEALLDGPLGAGSAPLLAWAHWQVAGFRLGCLENGDTLDQDRRELGPTYLVATAAGYRAIHDYALARLPRRGWDRRLVDGALTAAARGELSGLGRATVLRLLRERLGLARVRSAVLVGAPLEPATRDFFRGLGIRLSGAAALIETQERQRRSPAVDLPGAEERASWMAAS
jgi:long-chain acyl-CoA synthetase